MPLDGFSCPFSSNFVLQQFMMSEEATDEGKLKYRKFLVEVTKWLPQLEFVALQDKTYSCNSVYDKLWLSSEMKI